MTNTETSGGENPTISDEMAEFDFITAVIKLCRERGHVVSAIETTQTINTVSVKRRLEFA